MINVQQCLDEWKYLKGERSYWDSWWQGISEHVRPSRSYFTESSITPDGQQFDRVLDNTAAEACDGLANMMTSQLTPFNQQWMDWTPPVELEDDEQAVSWFKDLGEKAMKYLAASTFYSDIHETNLDVSGFGTGSLYLGEGKSTLFQFKNIELGSFCFREDEDGIPDEMWREIKMTPAQAAKEFGEENLSSEMYGALKHSSPGKRNEKYTIIHVVKPREDYDPDKIDRMGMPYAEYYIEEKSKHLIEEGGYQSFPFMVRRFQKWGEFSWGLSPARKCMPAIHQANFLQDMMDQLGELAVNPRIKSPANMVGEIDLRAGGITLVKDAQQEAMLKEWLTQGRYDIGQARIEEKQDTIKRMFFQSLWGNIAEKDKQMTAEEVRAIRDQQTLAFVPAFNRNATDSRPLHRRMFSMLINRRMHKPVPDKVRQYIGDTKQMPEPATIYNSQIALAVKRIQAQGFDIMYQRLMNVAQFSPEVMDEFDFSAAMREIARTEGVSEKWIRSKDDVAEIQQSRIEAQREQQQKADMAMAAEAAGKAPEQVVNAAMSQM